MLRRLPLVLMCFVGACTPLPNSDPTPPPVEVALPAPAPALPDPPAPAPRRDSLDVLVLGDSQISSGAGPSYLNFFRSLRQSCAGTALTNAQADALSGQRIRAVGVRSTALHSWTARDGAPKDTICEVDKTFGVNAAAFGTGAPSGKRYIQIGQEPGFQYCAPGRSAFETVFADKGNMPQLLVLSFLGNAQQRWAQSQRNADEDVRETLRQIPQGVPCIIMTTAPVFLSDANDERMIAQENLARAIAKHGKQCRLVSGLNARTRAAIEGQPEFFRRNSAGEVVDTLHPSSAAAELFFKLNAPQLCNAIAAAL